MKPGRSVFVIGPSGTGKSTFLRGALIAEGSGAVALAPSVDEYASYSDLAEIEGFAIKGFDEFDTLLQWLRKVYAVNAKALRDSGELVHRVLGLDTFTGIDRLAVLKQLSRLGLEDIPKAQSPEGADFYSGLRKDMEMVAHVCSAIRGLGLHWIATGHTMERQDEAAMDQLEAGPKQQLPIFRGSFRNAAPAPFDLVLHSLKRKQGNELIYALQWKSGAKKAAKSRLGDLADGAFIPASWIEVKQRVDAAEARRKEELLKALGRS